MKKAGVFLLLACLLAGCSQRNTEMEQGLQLRSKLLKAEEVSFSVDISADYGDKLQLFSMDCTADAGGDMRFSVTAPDTIAGITGTIAQGSGALTFDDVVLHFELLTDQQLSPVSAPWILLKTLRSGYITSAGAEGDSIRLTIDDSYAEDALQLDVWLDRQGLPQRTEILYDGRNILSILVRDFQIR